MKNVRNQGMELDKYKKREVTTKTITCPYCNVRAQAESNTRIIDAETGAIKLYSECRKCYLNECYHSVIMVARTLLMHVAVDKVDTAGKSFAKYIDYFQQKGFIGSQNKEWVDKIRTIGNKYVHQLDEATSEDAQKVIMFIKQLLGNLYEMPQLAR